MSKVPIHALRSNITLAAQGYQIKARWRVAAQFMNGSRLIRAKKEHRDFQECDDDQTALESSGAYPSAEG